MEALQFYIHKRFSLTARTDFTFRSKEVSTGKSFECFIDDNC